MLMTRKCKQTRQAGVVHAEQTTSPPRLLLLPIDIFVSVFLRIPTCFINSDGSNELGMLNLIGMRSFEVI